MLELIADPRRSPPEQTVDGPAPVRLLLASFIRHQRYVPRRARAVHIASALPPSRERVALEAQMRGPRVARVDG